MRTAQAMSTDKVSPGKLDELEPKTFRLPTYGGNGVELFLKTQQNRDMKRDFMAELIMRSNGREQSVIVDRDELIMHLKIE